LNSRSLRSQRSALYHLASYTIDAGFLDRPGAVQQFKVGLVVTHRPFITPAPLRIGYRPDVLSRGFAFSGCVRRVRILQVTSSWRSNSRRLLRLNGQRASCTFPADCSARRWAGRAGGCERRSQTFALRFQRPPFVSTQTISHHGCGSRNQTCALRFQRPAFLSAETIPQW
jgi:hypothetical protein